MLKIEFIVAFALLITMCTGVASATWTSSIYVTALPTSSDGSSPPPYVRTFGIDGNATDGFDRDYDVTAPPAPTVDALDTYFPCSHEVVTRLATDMKADADTITWTLKVTVPDGSTVDMNWDASNAPSDKTLVMNTNNASIDMKTQGSITFETGSYSLSVTSSKVVQDDSTPTTSTSGGSGGGGGGTSGEDFYNIILSQTDRQSVFKNSNISFRFEHEESILQHIYFTALNSAGTITAKVEILKNTSTLVSTPPSHKVFKNLNILVGNYGWATDKNIKDITIDFKVEKNWIEDNDIVVLTIRLCRYHDDVWNPLPTKKSGEDDTYMYFEAKTPGFSPFVITGSTEEEVAAQGADIGTTSSNISEQTTIQDANADVDDASWDEAQQDDKNISMVWSLVFALIVVLACIVYHVYKTKTEEDGKSDDKNRSYR